MAILSGRIGIGGALHVFKIVFEILVTRVSSEVDAVGHCSIVRFIWLSNILMRSLIWFELASKNCVWNLSRFSFGMGFSICCGGSDLGVGILAINVLGGICSCMDRWSEIRSRFWFVVDLYSLLFGVFMKNPFIRLLCV